MKSMTVLFLKKICLKSAMAKITENTSASASYRHRMKKEEIMYRWENDDIKLTLENTLYCNYIDCEKAISWNVLQI